MLLRGLALRSSGPDPVSRAHLQMDYSGPQSGARRRNCYEGAYYSEAPSGAYSALPSASFPLLLEFSLPT